MIAFSRTRDPAALAVGLANTWDELDAAPEFLQNPARLRKLLRFYGQSQLAARVEDGDVPRVIGVRDELRAAFAADGPTEAAAILNAILQANAAAPQLVRTRGGWRYRYHPETAAVAQVLAVKSALALEDIIREGGWSRFGHCAADQCDCVFVDVSRNHSRRYCSRLCADRVSQAAYRRRRRAPRTAPERRHQTPSSRHQAR
jgi:predicted RNA-binding Zn ribbon-like protein